jgi:hypothetical protein
VSRFFISVVSDSECFSNSFLISVFIPSVINARSSEMSFSCSSTISFVSFHRLLFPDSSSRMAVAHIRFHIAVCCIFESAI